MSGAAMGLVHVIRHASGKPWPITAPPPLPERDEWISDQVANYVPAPSIIGTHLQDRVKEGRNRPGFCARCDVCWTDTAASCWSCGPPSASSDFPTF